jgi:hypothetical protein
VNPANLLTDLEDFIHDHRRHGTLTGDATEPAWNGYLLTVACPCLVVFKRWVTSVDVGNSGPPLRCDEQALIRRWLACGALLLRVVVFS